MNVHSHGFSYSIIFIKKHPTDSENLVSDSRDFLTIVLWSEIRTSQQLCCKFWNLSLFFLVPGSDVCATMTKVKFEFSPLATLLVYRMLVCRRLHFSPPTMFIYHEPKRLRWIDCLSILRRPRRSSFTCVSPFQLLRRPDLWRRLVIFECRQGCMKNGATPGACVREENAAPGKHMIKLGALICRRDVWVFSKAREAPPTNRFGWEKNLQDSEVCSYGHCTRKIVLNI